MQLFYDPAIVPPLHTLGEEESKHCIRVLRLGRGATLHIADGRGTLHRCRIVEDDPRRCTVEVVETIHDFERLSYALTVAVAPTKNADRFEWFLEKATEVGIGAVIPPSKRSTASGASSRPSGREDHHGGHEAVAQGIPPPGAASAHPVPRGGARPPSRGGG